MHIEYQLLTLTKNQFSRPGSRLNAVKGIVMHWVANPKSTAKNNRDYFENLKSQNANDKKARYASAHYVIGLEGEVIQCIPDDEIAYHVGAQKYNAAALAALETTYPNNCSIGIELCHPDWTGKFESKTLDAARELCRFLIKKHEIKQGNIFRHFDITGKECPLYFTRHEDEWKKFLESTL